MLHLPLLLGSTLALCGDVNAVLVTTATQEKSYLFSENPAITVSDGNVVVSTSSSTSVVVCTVEELVSIKTTNVSSDDSHPTALLPVEADCQAEYYSLDGKRVISPESGKLYIVMVGNETRKIICK